MSSRLRLIALTLAAAIGACAYTGGGETGTGATGTEITTTGVITGFGSIFVGGVEYFTDGATILVDGQALDESQLAVGMVVTLSGTLDADGTTGRAREVAYRKNLLGPVESNSLTPGATSGTLTVLGQTIETDPYTVFEGNAQITTLDQLTPGNVVEISGFATATGLLAARIELKDSAPETMELRGRIQNLDQANGTFRIGALTIHYQGASLEGTLANGTVIKVSGTLQNGILNAREIEIEEALPGQPAPQPGREVELEGIIVIEGDTVTLNGQAINLPAHLLAQLQNGDRVEIRGRFDAQGQLQVEELEIRPRQQETAEVHARIETLDGDTRTLTVLGTRYRVTALTLMDDGPRFSLDDLAPGDWVELRVYADGDAWAIARLQREDDSDWQLQGTVQLIDGQPHIAGIAITTSDPLNDGQRVACTSTDGINWSCQNEDSDNGNKPHGDNNDSGDASNNHGAPDQPDGLGEETGPDESRGEGGGETGQASPDPDDHAPEGAGAPPSDPGAGPGGENTADEPPEPPNHDHTP